MCRVPDLINRYSDCHPGAGTFRRVLLVGGTLSQFLKDLGKTPVKKYQPKTTMVFSAHWDTDGTRPGARRPCVVPAMYVYPSTIVTGYGDEYPLYCDYYRFSGELLRLRFKLYGDLGLENHIVGLSSKVDDLDLPRIMTTLTYVLSGWVDRQDHTDFRASRCGLSWEKVSWLWPWGRVKIGQVLDELRCVRAPDSIR